MSCFYVTCLASAQPRRKVIINEDCSGPGGSNMQTLLVMIQSPQVEVLGITVVSGDLARRRSRAHPSLARDHGPHRHSCRPRRHFPLVRTREESRLWQQRYGKVAYAGAWDERWWHDPFVVPPFQKVSHNQTCGRDAAHFLIRMVRKYPHEVTIYEGGPMTNLALAISLDPQFPELAQELVFMGGSLSPQTDNPEFMNNPRHEFNFWFDPEAAEIVLRARWKKIVCTPTDISIKTHMTPAHDKADRSKRNSARALHRPFLHAYAGRRHHVGRTGSRRVDRSYASLRRPRAATWPSISNPAQAMGIPLPGHPRML